MHTPENLTTAAHAIDLSTGKINQGDAAAVCIYLMATIESGRNQKRYGLFREDYEDTLSAIYLDGDAKDAPAVIGIHGHPRSGYGAQPDVNAAVWNHIDKSANRRPSDGDIISSFWIDGPGYSIHRCRTARGIYRKLFGNDVPSTLT